MHTYRYMISGAETIHKVNPKVLVIFSGMDFDKDLSFLDPNRVRLSFEKKLVFEVHWYGFNNADQWNNGNLNQVCSKISNNLMKNAGFLLDNGFPLFMSEFGIDQRGGNTADNRYLTCFLAFAIELDIEWAIWTLHASYYIRDGIPDMEEDYSVLSYDWASPRNVTILRILSSIQVPYIGIYITIIYLFTCLHTHFVNFHDLE